LSNAVTSVGGPKLKGGDQMDKKRIGADASRAYMFALKGITGAKATGGNKLLHKPSCYGVALKWLIYIRGLTYAQFAKAYNGTTGQNANYLINRVEKEKFLNEDLEKMCSVLSIEYDYFMELCEEIEKKMEG
jgi:hypothetical protein